MRDRRGRPPKRRDPAEFTHSTTFRFEARVKNMLIDLAEKEDRTMTDILSAMIQERWEEIVGE